MTTLERVHSKEYAESRGRIVDLVRALDVEELDAMVPACPEWRVRDVVAHVGGLTIDVLGGNLDAYGSDPWTEKQVEERKDLPIDEVLDEWLGAADHYDALLESNPGFLPMITTADLVTHEQDIRAAVNQPGARDVEGVRMGVKTYVGRLRRDMEGLPPLRIDVEGFRDFMVGQGDPVASVKEGTFEMFRALGGRRSRAQVLAYEWEGDPQPYLDRWNLGPFAWPASDITE